MKSRASFKSHPLHPILVCFPIAFFIGALISDFVTVIFDKPVLSFTASLLNFAGVVAGLVAAVPGLIDLVNTIPPASSAKKRGVRHGLTNTLVVILFTIVWFCRKNDNISPYIFLFIETVAVILMGFAGWMGGTLVYRNQIGVDMRYANAKKWKEEFYDATTSPLDIGATDSVEINQMKLLHVGNKRIVLGRTEEGVVAFDDRCSHKGGSLAGGAMICGKVQCPWHGSQFNTLNGNVEAGPAKEAICIYKVEPVNGRLLLYF
jgi:uncharacterized membrane protein/nitrite reductase/ring-hydroxylating ferredoxin subunit